MPLKNIIDHRKRPYQFKRINAVIEPTRHDNNVHGADRVEPDPVMDKRWLGYDEKEHVSLEKAIQWASLHADEVTIYLYDHDDGIYEEGKRRRISSIERTKRGG